MSKLVDSSTWQYERLVIAYPDEKTLRTPLRTNERCFATKI